MIAASLPWYTRGVSAPTEDDAGRGAATVYRGMIMLACLFACVAGVNYLQALFDRGDLRRALGVVHDFHGAEGRTMEDAIRSRHGDRLSGPVAWDVGTHSSCYGVMLVTATAPLRDGSPAVYRFHVDLVNNGIHPADDNGRDVLQDLSTGAAPPGNVAPTAGVPPAKDPQGPP